MQDKLENDLEVVGNSFTLTDYTKRMNKVMNADNEKFNAIPDNQYLVNQHLDKY